MTLLPRGSTLWLLGHEMRLAWRGAGGKTNRGVIVLIVVAGVLALTVGLPLAFALSRTQIPMRPETVVAVDGALVFLFTLMLSGTLAATTQVFFLRGDLDLLLSSPLPARRVLIARCVGMAVNAASLFLLLVSPMVLPTIIFGHPEWLAVYPVLVSLSLLATTVGLVLSMTLFALIGPRATRTLAQVLAAIIGAAFFAGGQLWRFWVKDNQQVFTDRFQEAVRSGVFAPDQPAAWPAQAMLGHPLPALAIFGGTTVVFLITASVVGGRCARNAAAAAGLGAPGKSKRGRVSGFDGGPFGAMLRKEMRLMRRDIVLLSQVLLRLIYLVVMGVVLWKSVATLGDVGAPALAGGVVFMAGQLAASFAWITMSGEEGAELLASSPALARVLRRAKLVAALIPTAILLAIPLGAVAWLSPRVGAITALGCAAAALSASLIAIWYERPTPRSDFRRRRNASLVAAFAEFLLGVLWAGATALAAGPFWMLTAAPVILAVVALFALQRPQKSFAEVLQSK